MQKNIILVVAGVGYQPHEFRAPKEILEKAGHKVTVASNSKNLAQAAYDGNSTKVDLTLEEIELAKFDGVFLIGGPGALEHLNNNIMHSILNEAMIREMPYGAICISPRILAEAHVLIGKKATGWNGDENLVKIFEENNVIYEEKPVVTDGNIITADGPTSAELFGEAILKILE